MPKEHAPDIAPLTPGLAETIANDLAGKAVKAVIEGSGTYSQETTEVIEGISEGTGHLPPYVTIKITHEDGGKITCRRNLTPDQIVDIREATEDDTPLEPPVDMQAYRRRPSLVGAFGSLLSRG